MTTTRLTAAQALVKAMAAQATTIDSQTIPLFGGVWAIFGHGNVAGLGEALHAERHRLPVYRAHNEQGMALAATAFAKASRRRRLMACTTSIGPGALNMVTAAGVAHANRLPLLLLPGDVFANRRPDPVLQQIEDFADGTLTANDCFRPVSRYFDRITRPEQIVPAFEHALQILTDPAACGPVTLAFCQDVQTEAADYPAWFFEPRTWQPRRPRPDITELTAALELLRHARRPLIVAGGGVLYSGAEAALARFCAERGIPAAETQAGKSALPDHAPWAMGAIGVTGTAAANRLAAEADVILAIGTRLQDFTTGSGALFAAPGRRLIGLNLQPLDAAKFQAQPLVADVLAGLDALADALGPWRAPGAWTDHAAAARRQWDEDAAGFTRAGNTDTLPTDAQVVGAVQRQLQPGDIVVGAAGGLPGELHKLFRPAAALGYHMEYGFSCMGYEIAGGLGVKLAQPQARVVVMVGDGSYLMLNSELATSVMLGCPLTVVVLDNRGFGCIDRLQRATGGAGFNNLLKDTHHDTLPEIDFTAHARSLGTTAEKVASLKDLETALAASRDAARTHVIVIDTDPAASTPAGGHWWDVAVPEVSERPEVLAARRKYLAAVAKRDEIVGSAHTRQGPEALGSR
jgi:3D-(3,5/4)-trihydroxycyclohexane-1,2-dione acylhydrolase (decyclizing)